MEPEYIGDSAKAELSLAIPSQPLLEGEVKDRAQVMPILGLPGSPQAAVGDRGFSQNHKIR